ncbi:MAG TPA: AsmA family protein [Rhizobacter sp.]|nr:AsmA family protein [Rhizobacter sp.]
MTTPWIRKLLIGVGVFVLLMAAVLTYLVATFDANAYKSLAIDWMKTHRDRTLVIGGPVKLSVFPRLAVQVSGVTLSEKGRADEFISLDEAALSVAVLPLLRQQVVVDRVSARGLRMNYRRSASGATNVDDWLASKTAATPGSEPDKSPTARGPALHFDVSRVQLDDLRLTLHDEQAKLAGVVTLKSLSTGRLADQVESPVKLDAQVALTEPAVQGELTGSTLLTPALADKGLHLRDMALAWQGSLPGAQAVSASLRGTLAFDGNKGTLQADAVELSGDASLGTLRLANSTLALERFAYDPGNKELLLSKLRIKLGGSSSGHPLGLNLDWPTLSVKGDSLTGSALSGQISLQGPNTIEASFKTAAPSGSFERIVVPNVDSTLTGRSGPRQLGGTLQATLLLSPDKGTLALNDLSTRLQLQEPSLAPLVIAIEGKADASSKTAHWALKGQINTNPFTSEGSAIMATTPLTLTVSAHFDTLDLNRLLLPAAAASGAARPSPGASKADAPIDLSALRELQGRFDLRVGQFAYQTYRVNDAVVAATLEGGMLRVNQLAGKAWGGSFTGTAFADARASRVALNATATGVNVNTLLKDVAHKDVLEGTGRVVLNVDGAGRSANELKSRLKGAAGLQLRDGAIKGVNLAKSLRQAKATLGMKPSDERQKANQNEKTDFSELNASFVITEGVARNNDLDVKSPFLRLGGDGALDIGKGVIDYTVRATVAPTSKGQDGAELAALKGMTFPVHLSGPFEAMDWRIEWSAVALQVLQTEAGSQAKQKLLEKLGLPSAASAASGSDSEAAKAAREKLKERLRGIFK